MEHAKAATKIIAIPETGHARIEQLTGLRFIAAFAVLLTHFRGLSVQVPLEPLWHLGGYGVQLFFILSGFLLTLRYGHGAFSWRSYAVARLARVVPVYWFVLGITALAYWMTDSAVSLGPKPASADQAVQGFLLNALALQAWVSSDHVQQFWNAPGWSISAEFFFYACFPLFLRWRFLDGSVRSFLFAGIGYCLLTALKMAITADAVAYSDRFPLLNFGAFATGILACRWMQRQYGQPVLRGRLMVTFILLALFLSTNWLMRDYLFPGWVETISPCVVYLLFASLIVNLAQDRGLAGRTLSHPIFVLLGNASYALYLIHWLALGVATLRYGQAGKATLEMVFLMLASLVLLSIGVYKLFEAPAQRYVVRVFQPK